MATSGDDARVTDLPALSIRLKEARERAGLTQEQLGDLVGRSQSTIDGYEHGRQPKIALLQKIAAICSVQEEWLISGKDVVNPSQEQSMPDVVPESEDDSARFAWTVNRVRELIGQERFGTDDTGFLFGYAKKLMRLVQGESDDAKAKEAILRAIEFDRQEWRRELKRLADRFL